MGLSDFERDELARRIEMLRESLAEMERWFRRIQGLPVREVYPMRLPPMPTGGGPPEAAAELFKALRGIDNAILERRPMWEIAILVLRQVERWVRCRRASVVEFDRSKGVMRVLAVLVGGETDVGAGHEAPLAEFGVDEALERGEVYLAPLPEPDEHTSRLNRALYREGVRARLNVPMRYGDQLIGSLNVGFEQATEVPEATLGALHDLADRMALAIARRRMEQALSDSEQWHRRIFHGSLEAMLVLDAEGRIRDLNPAALELLGRDDADAVKGTCFGDLVDSPFNDAEGSHRRRVLAGETLKLEGRIERPASAAGERETRHVEMVFNGLDLAGGPHILAHVHDVTDRRRAERERRQFEAQMLHTQKLESLGVLAGGIAHDFNNLLTAIMGNASLAKLHLPENAPVRHYLDQIELGAQSAADLCRQMLAYAGRGRLVVEPIDLSRVVEEMSHLMEISISKKIVLKYRLEPNLPPIRADVSQVRQIVMNLITNASDAIGSKSGIITISTGAMHCDRDYLRTTYLIAEDLPEGGYVYLEVSDTGAGMDKATMERIFEPFFTTKFAGRGLGLAAVQGIVRSHRGALKVYSEPGRGTTFKILFPFASDAVAPARPAASVAATAELHGVGTVLVVDDEETVRALAIHALEAFGFQAEGAADGAEALRRFSQDPLRYDLVLLDLTMPRMGGEEVYRELRRLRPDVRVVLSSGYSEDEATDRFAGKNLAGFIQKPYRAAQLLEVVKTALAR